MRPLRFLGVDFLALARLRSLVWRAFRSYRRQIAVLAGLGLATGLLEAVGVNMLIPLFSYFTEGESRIGTDVVTRSVEAVFSFLHIPLSVPSLLILICILFTAKAAVTLYFNYLRADVRALYQERMMGSLLSRVLSASWPHLMKQKLGGLETTLVTNVGQSALLLESLTGLVGILAGLLMYFLVAVNISQAVTAITLAVGILIFFAIKPILSAARRLAERAERNTRDIARFTNEAVVGLKEIKASGSEGAIVGMGERLFASMRLFHVRSQFLGQLSYVLFQPLSVLLIAAIVAFAYYQTSYNLGALAAIIYLIQRMFSYLQNLQNSLHMLVTSAPHLERILAAQEEANQARETERPGLGKPFVFTDKLSFEGVDFAYEEGKGEALSEISFDIPRGSSIGFVGKSGAGKTTVFDLVLRLLEPTRGAITLDGLSIKEISLTDWRKHIAYVSQDIFLANDTVYNNIVFYDPSVSREDVERAVSLAHADEFIRELPQGLDTIVGERGMRLSGGQRQRIAIARALVRKPDILLLDEATSALDLESEAAVKAAIKSLKSSVTILIIAHRLSTVAESDKVIVLGKGKVLESGTPADILPKLEKRSVEPR